MEHMRPRGPYLKSTRFFMSSRCSFISSAHASSQGNTCWPCHTSSAALTMGPNFPWLSSRSTYCLFFFFFFFTLFLSLSDLEPLKLTPQQFLNSRQWFLQSPLFHLLRLVSYDFIPLYHESYLILTLIRTRANR